MTLSAITRVCPIDLTPLPDPPAAAVCAACGYVGAPHHTVWPAVVKWWVLSEMSVQSFLGPSTAHAVWERKLQAAMLGTHLTNPNPWGLAISTSTPAAELYPLAVERAAWWRASGSPIAIRILSPRAD